LPARAALSSATMALWTIPLRRSPHARPASADQFEHDTLPCGFTLSECDAVKLDVGVSLAILASSNAPRERGG
jgi:hypothetical protein